MIVASLYVPAVASAQSQPLPPGLHLVRRSGDEVGLKAVCGRKGKPKAVFIRADARVTYSQFMQVVSTLQDCGVKPMPLAIVGRDK